MSAVPRRKRPPSAPPATGPSDSAGLRCAASAKRRSAGLAVAFGRVLAQARTACGRSQEEVAELADFDRTYPSLVERGLREPKLSSFLRLAAAVNRSPFDLLALTLGAAHGRFTELPPPDFAGHAVTQSPPAGPGVQPPAGTASSNSICPDSDHSAAVQPPATQSLQPPQSPELQALLAAVGEWPPWVRRVFTLRKVYDFSPAQIARTLEVSEAEVERALVAAVLAVDRACHPQPNESNSAPGLHPAPGDAVRSTAVRSTAVRSTAVRST